MKNIAIILVAGNSTRFNSKQIKQLYKLGKKPVFSYSLNAFAKCGKIDEIIVVSNEKVVKEINKFVKKNDIKNCNVILGGNSRQESVENALKTLTTLDKDDIVIIHDGARPLIDNSTILEIIETANESGAATTYLEVEDSIATRNNDEISSYEDRSKLVKIQTPQAFKYELIAKGHSKSDKIVATDDCSLILNLGYKVKLVKGSKRLTKITTIEDIKYLEGLLK